MDLKQFERVATVAGYDNTVDITKRYFAPVLGTTLLLTFLIPLFIDLPWYGSLIVFFVGLIFTVSYPFIKYQEMKKSVNTNLHYFITYAGTLSTVRVPRVVLFKNISENQNFGHISSVFKKINYLAKDWTLGFAKATREMSSRVPSAILGDFLDRFAVALDFGQDLEVFLDEEQTSIMEDFRVEYEQSLETIKLLQDTFIALSVSFSFVLGITLLAPLLLETPLEAILPYAIGFILFVDIGLIVSVRNYVPTDDLVSQIDKYSREEEEIFYAFWLTTAACTLIFMLLQLLLNLNLLLTLAISITPLVYPGYLVMIHEEKVKKRDKQFPVFARVLGNAIEVKDGAVVSALKSTQVHDFGALDDISVRLYKRLRMGNDRWKSWDYFMLESGSNLIANFGRIFAESIYLGGNSQKIGEIVSKNSQELLSLRKLRMQLANGLRGAFYGTLVGLSSVIYITAKISQLLVDIFNQPLGVEGTEFNFATNILPAAESINFETVLLYIAILVIIHSASSSIIMKVIDGGSWYGAVVDFIIMIWIGAMLETFLPVLVDGLLPDITEFEVNETNTSASVDTPSVDSPEV